MKPTAIIVKKMIKHGRTKRYLIKCNDGKTYTVASLAAVFGRTSMDLWRIISQEGWDSPKLFQPKKNKSGRTKAERQAALAAIPGPTSYEEQLWGR